LHYCTRNQTTDTFAQRLTTLCATLPSVRLHIHDASRGAALNAQALAASGKSEIWFCGPAGLGKALRDGLKSMGVMPRFHQEAFEMR
jgi:predicted ferric reductase